MAKQNSGPRFCVFEKRPSRSQKKSKQVWIAPASKAYELLIEMMRVAHNE